MSDLNKIKETVRKLMAVAGDGVASEAEIDTAMRLAAKLMDAHHLDQSDIGTEADKDDLTMGRTFTTTYGTKFLAWEATLYNAIIDLFGCLQGYLDGDVAPVRVNGMVQMERGQIRQGRKLYFYGPAVESAEAAELYKEWCWAIATMGIARYNACVRGDGAMYCLGFAKALRDKARQINGERKLTAARPLPQLQGSTCTALTLTGRYELLKVEGKKWLAAECGVKLPGGDGRSRSVSYSGDRNAMSEGYSHGQKTAFGRTPASKRLGAGR